MSDPIPESSLSPEYHIAIGVITVNGALMDQLVETAIWMVLKMPPERGVTVTKLIANTSRKIQFLRDLLDPMFVDDEIRTDFHEVYSKLKSAQKNRSKIVHAKWVFKQSDGTIHIELPLTEETLPVVEPMPLKQLQRYGSEIATSHRALENFFLQADIQVDTSGTYQWPPRTEGRKFHQK
tara:strand:+ start:1393 stop:1932 length:540 start_codon:yes stop_codon:yes gene_type:complete